MMSLRHACLQAYLPVFSADIQNIKNFVLTDMQDEATNMHRMHDQRYVDFTSATSAGERVLTPQPL